jgi:ABC-type Fe3+ transport system permease subunit
LKDFLAEVSAKMKPIHYVISIFLVLIPLIAPGTVFGAEQSGGVWGRFDQFWIDRYNAGPYSFGLWCTLLTALWGTILGFSLDRLMKLTGLDLTSRTTIEH